MPMSFADKKSFVGVLCKKVVWGILFVIVVSVC